MRSNWREVTDVLKESPCEDNRVGQEESREASSEAVAVFRLEMVLDPRSPPPVDGASLYIAVGCFLFTPVLGVHR